MSDAALRTIRLSAVGSVAILPILILPAMIGGLIDHADFSESAAGWVAAVGFAGSALGAILFGLRIRHLDPRKLAVIGLLTLALGDALSAFVAQLPVSLFLCCRALSGLGGAAAYAAVMASIAASPKPERGYGTFMMFQFALSAFGLYLLPRVLPGIGAAGMYAGLALVAAAALTQAGVVLQRTRIAEEGAIEVRVLLKPAATLAMLGIGFYEMANMMHFTYAERIGIGFGLPQYRIGEILGVATLFGVPAALSVIWLGDRYGQVRPIMFALLLSVAALLFLLQPDGTATYVVTMCALSIAWAFGLPFFQAFAARLDPGGSVVVTAGFFTAGGGALGPAIAAALVGPEEYGDVLVFAIGVYGLVVWLMTMARHFARRA